LHKIKQILHKIKQNTIAKKYRYIGIIGIFFPVSVFGVFQIPQQPNLNHAANLKNKCARA
jgi:hypothetical protein